MKLAHAIYKKMSIYALKIKPEDWSGLAEQVEEAK